MSSTLSSKPTMADIFPQQYKSYADYHHEDHPSRNRNIHDDAETSESIEEKSDDESALDIMTCYVEMLVVIMKDDVAWASLQLAMRNEITTMGLQQSLPTLVKDHFRIAVERQRENMLEASFETAFCDSYRDSPIHGEIKDSSTAETESTGSDDTWDDGMSGDSGEFLMGGCRGQGLQPISYKDIDLVQHQRAEIIGFNLMDPTQNAPAEVRFV